MKQIKNKFLKPNNRKKKIEVKPINQKKMNLCFLGGFAFFVILACLSIFLSFTKQTIQPKATVQVVESSSDTTNTNYRLESFLNEYVKAYFNFSDQTEAQDKQIEALNQFYNFVPEIKAQGLKRQAMQLKSSRIESIGKDTAVYRITYQSDNQEITTNFNIPYGEKNNQYYVSGLPYYSEIQDLIVNKSSTKDQLKLSGMDSFSDKERKTMTTFLELFFKNYTTNQENLKLIAKNVAVVSNQDFKTIDYTYFKQDGKNIVAYVQATFEIAGTTHSENFTFTIEPKGDSYFITDLKHAIPVDYNKEDSQENGGND
ncbi:MULTISPECIES: conjugal transfer protein [unclassified Enterococcus]|uniref:conjugal transfer protein n=1 Tax=unclassified Enterococcus TaxID=2608891 RepID=UPI0015562545|nr:MULTISPECIES: conjugal transfer protein [unclassified Enterococcus]MBS7576113.1 conjugal transfer protein [Enterococcus sp. MMGLQ5-2]MBS7583346.1 conjugal transfer protein [Enterococcus sp. MMGLQ5-1]NPD11206.1 conjugal transfer protein [Enterococcus sp. MMGLQ5-1]NPD35949.1 conjugal transfer protein [Enterococcus sp. MMGLQ5-2]